MKGFILTLITIFSCVLLSQEYNFISQYEGSNPTGIRYEDYVYFNSGGNIHILDFSDPDNISLIDDFHIGHQMAYSMHIKDELLFIGISRGCLIYSLENPDNPQLLNHISAQNNTVRMIFTVDSLLINIDVGIARIYNIENPNEPEYLSYITFEYDEQAFCLNNRILYGSVQVGYSGPQYILGYDLTDAENPEIIADYLFGWYYDPHPDYMVTRENNLFVAVNDSCKIYDISVNDEINHITTFELPEYVDIIRIENDIMFVESDDSNLLLLDISDIENPEVLTTHEIGYDISDVFITSNFILVSGYSLGFSILNFSDVNDIHQIYSYDETDSFYAIKILDDLAYMSSHVDGLEIIDISNIEEHQTLGHYPAEMFETIELYDSYLYCFNDFDTLLTIFDVYDPQNPFPTGTIEMENYISDFCLVENYLYVMEFNSGMHIFDLTEPGTPYEIFFESISGSKLNVFENLLYLADQASEYPYEKYLKLYNIDNFSFELLSQVLLGEGTEYSVKDIFFEYDENPEIYLHLYRGVASLSNSSNQLILNDVLILPGITSKTFYDGYYIYAANSLGSGSINVINPDLEIGIETTIPAYANGFSKHHNTLFITQSSSGYSIYDIPYTDVLENEYDPSTDHFLIRNYPNPFNQSTSLTFSIPEECRQNSIELNIYNIKGQLINTLISEPSNFKERAITWFGDNFENEPVSTGIYLYTLEIDGKPKATRKMTLLR
ncbi:MAG TPA: T9SS type A sorting domain-containing protein [Candidatus Cloacimonetes bacterium]|nr:T9SS type A sorting domain-containing protein [Candidatus Cloacimonadota bacterium]